MYLYYFLEFSERGPVRHRGIDAASAPAVPQQPQRDPRQQLQLHPLPERRRDAAGAPRLHRRHRARPRDLRSAQGGGYFGEEEEDEGLLTGRHQHHAAARTVEGLHPVTVRPRLRASNPA